MILKGKYIAVVWSLLAILLLGSCNRVTVIVDKIPSNTPIGDPIYISGNFNHWSPGNEKYQLQLDKDSSYYFHIPAGYGHLEYKFTRGNWASVEKDRCGGEINDRFFNANHSDTLIHIIESWSDLEPVNCKQRTIIIDKLPDYTPSGALIELAGDINSWGPTEEFRFMDYEDGKLFLTIEKPEEVNKMEYKITRGDLSSVETDVFGNDIPNRQLEFGKKDTIYLKLGAWKDLVSKRSEYVTLVIRDLPQATPTTDLLYLASPLSDWDSGDDDFEFQRNKNGQLYFQLPRKDMDLDYKITRDGWHTVEVDRLGFDISNRQVDLASADTVFIDVLRWKDQSELGNKNITLVLDQLPATTPENAQIFISGNFNHWNPGRFKYAFKQAIDGKYYVNIKREKGQLEFKITRGNWESEAINELGSQALLFQMQYPELDTVFISPPIANWKDKKNNPIQENITLVLRDLPNETPEHAEFYFSSDLNDWNPGSSSYQFKKSEEGMYYLNLKTEEAFFHYKITRGNWGNVECNKYHEDIENRIQYMGFVDTVFVDITRWKDR